ncbi:MAG: hypothetical protein JNL82_31725 [Myxococcales bacterium]|nr:hypothetical protein [Myxococcales bacterium]
MRVTASPVGGSLHVACARRSIEPPAPHAPFMAAAPRLRRPAAPPDPADMSR